MNSRLNLIFSLFILFPIAELHAQDKDAGIKASDSITTQTGSLPKATIKINLPVLLVDPKQAWFLATDLRIKERLTLDIGGGVYFQSWVFNRYKDESFSGVRIRLGLKHYYSLRRRVGGYLGFEALFNRWVTKQFYDVTLPGDMYNLINGGSRYEGRYVDKMLITTKSTSSGASARTGLQILIGPKKQFLFDVYMGFGVKTTNKDRDLPANAESISRDRRLWFLERLGNTDRDPGNFVNAYMTLGVYFGYCLW